MVGRHGGYSEVGLALEGTAGDVGVRSEGGGQARHRGGSVPPEEERRPGAFVAVARHAARTRLVALKRGGEEDDVLSAGTPRERLARLVCSGGKYFLFGIQKICLLRLKPGSARLDVIFIVPPRSWCR